MSKVDSIADMKTAKQTQEDFILNAVQDAKQSEVVYLRHQMDQQIIPLGVNSTVVHDSVAPGIEDTKTDGTAQGDLRGEVVPTTFGT